jgi:hypothetical protein
MQKPFNSPMLFASVASVSASSPASGEIADFHLVGLNYVNAENLPQRQAPEGLVDEKALVIRGTQLRFERAIDSQTMFDLDTKDPAAKRS